ISLVCLNLPPEIRYAPENIFLVGVIPGPKESVIQPYLAPLVDELLDLHKGRHFLSSSEVKGRLVQAFLVPVVCDMQAARKVIGFVPPVAKLACPYCKCKYEDMSNRDVINGHVERRSKQEWKEQAQAYQDAAGNSTLRVELRKENGVKWSELLRLPYWDPTRFAVVDAMHNLLLGLIQHHVRKI
ncbi:hypothetical protein EXIGLDRAFT_595926, partial [Exidia glandulosa HHB12029]